MDIIVSNIMRTGAIARWCAVNLLCFFVFLPVSYLLVPFSYRSNWFISSIDVMMIIAVIVGCCLVRYSFRVNRDINQQVDSSNVVTTLSDNQILGLKNTLYNIVINTSNPHTKPSEIVQVKEEVVDNEQITYATVSIVKLDESWKCPHIVLRVDFAEEQETE